MKRLLALLYKFNLRYKGAFFWGAVLLIVSRITINLYNFIFKYFIDALEQGLEINSLLLLLAALATTTFASIVFSNLGDIVSDIYIIRAARDIRLKIFSHLHKLDFSYHASKHSGSLISALKRGDGAYFSFNLEINRNLLKIFTDFIIISSTFFFVDKRLLLVVLVVVFLDLIIARILVGLNVKKRRRLNDEEDKITGIIVDNLINYETVKYFSKEAYEEGRMRKQYKSWYSSVWEYANSFRLINFSTGILAIAGVSISILIALHETTTGSLSLGDFVLVVSFVTAFFPRLSEIVYRFRELAKHYTDLEKYLGILEEPIEVKEKVGAKSIQITSGKIDFDKVTFTYKNRETVLKGLSLKIAPGESVALVGESGAGKTTLVKLLIRFYDVNTGSIKIDGQDISDVTKESLRNSIGIVPQEPILFNNTIAYNIGYAHEKASLQGIQNAAKLANLHGFIKSLPEKYDTLVGERGIKLSGGQKQRLAIARMFIEDPPIIVFDEATSQLDSSSERLIQEAFWRIAKDKTTLIIAHRLSTIRRADRILVLKSGKIAEQGKHDQLIGNPGGVYKHLWELQTGNILVDSKG